MSVGFVYDPIFLEHETGAHPENPDRLRATLALLEEAALLARLRRIDARDATADELALVHDPRYVAELERVAREGGGWADPDTLITPRSFDVAVRVVGGTLAAVDAVVAGDVGSAFCLVRP
ncbi:MAG: histone deacetylase, partial [Dehalococcoidia bacterium]